VRWLVYVCLRVRALARQIRPRYRRRFGIESGERLMEQVRARAISLNPALRFLLIGVALLIVNMWIGCTGCISASPVKGHAAWRGSTFVWNG
jgi:hypothetical protein